ncbi:MAG: hypothetical protein JSV36_04590 [Anaerolineae bacterium]|nr:MAG: hypothetical protein JSV36_04590 [Anaerolineae bacterium]
MAMTPSGAVQLFDQAAHIPLPMMVTSAVQSVVDASNILNAEYLALQEDWVTAGSPPPAPIQYAITRATINLRVTLAFNLQQSDVARSGWSLRTSARTGGLLSLFVKASANFATYANEYHANRFNLRGEYVNTIHIEIAPVFAPTASGT